MICVALAEQPFKAILEIIRQEEMAEIRIDLLDLTTEQLQHIYQNHPQLIATCRPGRYSDTERYLILADAMKNGAAYVDLEHDAPQDFRQSLTQLARTHGTQVIVSYHNFDLTPSLVKLQQILRICESQSADIVKIVTFCHTESDAERLLALYPVNTKPLIAFGMGTAGRKSRLAALRLGAPFIYAAADTGKPTAPGQMTKAEILHLLEKEPTNG